MAGNGTEYSCFKAYDIRGKVPNELNEEIAYRIGRAFAEHLQAKKICLGHDIRLTSPQLAAAAAKGINDAGCDVLDIGMVGTEEIYFATFNNDVDGGMVVTASHNPKDYNGMKLVQRGSAPISGDSGLGEIKRIAEQGKFSKPGKIGGVSALQSRADYIEHLLGYVDVDALRGLKVVVNAGHGGAGLVIDALESQLPIEFVKIFNNPDGHFPQGIPNPLLVENREATSNAVRESGADFGIAWDGDFDRCFLFDESGAFIEGYYIVGLLAEAFLNKSAQANKEKIVHDPRLVWNTQAIVQGFGATAVMSKTGHAFIKERMRKENAVYGGEMSAHHYFRDFAYCDSGMIPWLLVAELVAKKGQPLSQLVADRQLAYPVSGEINRKVADPAALLARIERDYTGTGGDAGHNVDAAIDHTDGLSVAYKEWRFNLRMSNTEPVVRLNVESRGDVRLMQEKTKELLALIDKA
ncbi:MAG: phosphomannomutase [Pseudomonadales bacterium]|nr:phosphomannomutase [Pseudomonadales bacterium]